MDEPSACKGVKALVVHSRYGILKKKMAGGQEDRQTGRQAKPESTLNRMRNAKISDTKNCPLERVAEKDIKNGKLDKQVCTH
ncbi:hypothetical protein POVCU2_0005240 [Plasmodium ovale curtisi]|uniref:Uncharacterized protein n=1 Tax=Plasmodium ovale curtisi TaxID=864141 RepID=A0A1A8VMA8_PLAOA|nr:hypothetical protein POVCU2_0005240 [Plasmodium ovale curtisi]